MSSVFLLQQALSFYKQKRSAILLYPNCQVLKQRSTSFAHRLTCSNVRLTVEFSGLMRFLPWNDLPLCNLGYEHSFFVATNCGHCLIDRVGFSEFAIAAVNVSIALDCGTGHARCQSVAKSDDFSRCFYILCHRTQSACSHDEAIPTTVKPFRLVCA